MDPEKKITIVIDDGPPINATFLPGSKGIAAVIRIDDEAAAKQIGKLIYIRGDF